MHVLIFFVVQQRRLTRMLIRDIQSIPPSLEPSVPVSVSPPRSPPPAPPSSSSDSAFTDGNTDINNVSDNTSGDGGQGGTSAALVSYGSSVVNSQIRALHSPRFIYCVDYHL